jgi:hypothetical protein
MINQIGISTIENSSVPDSALLSVNGKLPINGNVDLKLNDISGVLPSGSLPSHAYVHSLSGTDPINPENIGAAKKLHSHEYEYIEINSSNFLNNEFLIQPKRYAKYILSSIPNGNTKIKIPRTGWEAGDVLNFESLGSAVVLPGSTFALDFEVSASNSPIVPASGTYISCFFVSGSPPTPSKVGFNSNYIRTHSIITGNNNTLNNLKIKDIPRIQTNIYNEDGGFFEGYAFFQSLGPEILNTFPINVGGGIPILLNTPLGAFIEDRFIRKGDTAGTVASGNHLHTPQEIGAYPASNPSGFITGVDISSIQSAISLPYNDLKNLKNSGLLKSGQNYIINDFQLRWWNQSVNNTVVLTGSAIEPLVVTAVNASGIHTEAKSTLHPEDIVYYDIDATSSNTWGTRNINTPIPNFKGWIYRRNDTKKNIDIGWDWRYITNNCCRPDMSSVNLYNSGTTYNLHNVVKDVSGKLYYSVVNSNTNNNLTNTNFWLPVSPFNESQTYFATYITEDGELAFKTNNNISVSLPPLYQTRIQQPTFVTSLDQESQLNIENVNNIKIQNGFQNVIIGNNFYSNTIGEGFHSNTIGEGFQVNSIGNRFDTNVIGNGFTTNTIGEAFYSNIISNSFYGNNIVANFYFNTTSGPFIFNSVDIFFLENKIGSDFNYNNIGKDFTNNAVGNYFLHNTIGNNFISNTIGNNFNRNTIGVDFQSNTIGSSFYYNTIGNNFNSNTIGNLFYSNTIGNYFNSNTIGNESFYTNTIENNFSYNTVENNFSYNTIGNYFNSNTIGSSFTDNAVGSSFTNNAVGNNFRRNTIENNNSIGDVTGATHVYNNYNTRIFSNSNNTVRLSYFNTTDQLVVTDPTA